MHSIIWYCHLRVEYDAYRTDIESVQISPRDPAKQDEAQKKFAEHKAKYDKLRADVSIKLKFLEENKVCLGDGFYLSEWCCKKIYCGITVS